MNYATEGDMAIALASTVLAKGVYVLSPRGILLKEKEIETALELRHFSAKASKRGEYGKDQNLSVKKIGKFCAGIDEAFVEISI